MDEIAQKSLLECESETHITIDPRSQQRYLDLEELLEFAVESGKLHPKSLATEIKALKEVFYYPLPADFTINELCQAEAKLERLYASIMELITPVTLDTLHATSDKYPVQRNIITGMFKGRKCIGRNFFHQVAWVFVILIFIITAKNTIDAQYHDFMWFQLLTMLEPFAYGALGALIQLSKNITDLYAERTLNPDRLATNWLRVFMGAMAGWLMVFTFKVSMLEGGTDVIGGISLGAGAVGLLAGYSIEFFYRVLDRLIAAVLPGKVEQHTPPPITPQQAQQEALIALLSKTENEDDKATIRDLLNRI